MQALSVSLLLSIQPTNPSIPPPTPTPKEILLSRTHSTLHFLIGIGLCLVTTYLLRPSHIVIAAIRRPDALVSQTLESLPRGPGSTLIIVSIDSGSDMDARTAISTLQTGITKLDVVIANAGVSRYFGPAAATPAEEMRAHFAINAVAPLLLFQATLPLLAAAGAMGHTPKFVTVSSGAGSIGSMGALKVENTAYGASKAALNFVTRKIHFENEDIIAFAVNPGWLTTEVSDEFAEMQSL